MKKRLATLVLAFVTLFAAPPPSLYAQNPFKLTIVYNGIEYFHDDLIANFRIKDIKNLISNSKFVDIDNNNIPAIEVSDQVLYTEGSIKCSDEQTLRSLFSRQTEGTLYLFVIQKPETHAVKATAEIPIVCTADISWGDLTFIYKPTWDSEQCKYTSATWEPQSADSGTITITSRSNVPVSGSIKFVPDTNYKGVEEFNIDFFCESGRPVTIEGIAPTGLLNDGAAAQPQLDNTTIGNITVTITPVE